MITRNQMTDHERVFHASLVDRGTAAKAAGRDDEAKQIEQLLHSNLAFTVACARACHESGCDDVQVDFFGDDADAIHGALFDRLMVLVDYLVQKWPDILKIIQEIVPLFFTPAPE